jgi:hypothetical protein
MEQLRIYTLTDKETAEHYFNEHWSKHKIHLPKYGFQVKGVWVGNTPESENQVIAIVSFSDNADIEVLTQSYFKSPEFMNLFEKFDSSNFVNIETKIMRSAD